MKWGPHLHGCAPCMLKECLSPGFKQPPLFKFNSYKGMQFRHILLKFFHEKLMKCCKLKNTGRQAHVFESDEIPTAKILLQIVCKTVDLVDIRYSNIGMEVMQGNSVCVFVYIHIHIQTCNIYRASFHPGRLCPMKSRSCYHSSLSHLSCNTHDQRQV